MRWSRACGHLRPTHPTGNPCIGCALRTAHDREYRCKATSQCIDSMDAASSVIEERARKCRTTSELCPLRFQVFHSFTLGHLLPVFFEGGPVDPPLVQMMSCVRTAAL